MQTLFFNSEARNKIRNSTSNHPQWRAIMPDGAILVN